MATFSFFSTSKGDITRLIGQSKTLSEEAFATQVRSLFDSLIERRLSRAEQSDELLQAIILLELCGLIGTLPSADTYFIDHYKVVLDELIDACRWKRTLKTIDFDDCARTSLQRQADIRQWMTTILRRAEPTHVRRLTAMLTEPDQQAVAYRTLRVFLSSLYNQKKTIHTSTLFWLRDGRVQLRIKLVREYMFEQIALRVYLFHSVDEVLFIEEALSKVTHWVKSEVAERAGAMSAELEEGCNDIMSQIKLDFLHKCQRWKADPDVFYLDGKLTTYLYSFVKRSRAIGKLLGAQKEETDDSTISEGSGDDNGEPDERDDLSSAGEDYSGDESYLDTQMNKIRYYLKTIGEKCYDLVLRHFNNNFSEPVPFSTLAIELGKSESTLESRYDECMKKLKKMANGTL